jgi:hypothetical protein
MATKTHDLPASLKEPRNAYMSALASIGYYEGSRRSEAYSELSRAEIQAWNNLVDAAEAEGVSLRQLDDWLTESHSCKCSMCQDR